MKVIVIAVVVALVCANRDIDSKQNRDYLREVTRPDQELQESSEEYVFLKDMIRPSEEISQDYNQIQNFNFGVGKIVGGGHKPGKIEPTEYIVLRNYNSLDKASGVNNGLLESTAQENAIRSEVIRPLLETSLDNKEVEAFNLGIGRIMRHHDRNEALEQENMVIGGAISPHPKISPTRKKGDEYFVINDIIRSKAAAAAAKAKIKTSKPRQGGHSIEFLMIRDIIVPSPKHSNENREGLSEVEAFHLGKFFHKVEAKESNHTKNESS